MAPNLQRSEVLAWPPRRSRWDKKPTQPQGWTLSSFWCGDPERRLMLLLPVLCPLFLDKQCPAIRCPFVKGVGTEQPQEVWSVPHHLKFSTQIGISSPNATTSSRGFMLGDRVSLWLLPQARLDWMMGWMTFSLPTPGRKKDRFLCVMS